MKIRIKFSKTGNLKYIGHLDTMRCFQKIMRRAEVDSAYSEGFSPHQIMSFASPLGVGMTSEGEYVDIEVLSTESSAKMMERINRVSVDGIRITGYVKLPEKSKTAMSMVAAADYLLTFDVPVDQQTKDAFAEFLKQESVIIHKKTKKQELDMEIRPLIYKTEFLQNEKGQDQLFLQVSAGSAANLKPEQVMEAFAAWRNVPEGSLPFHNHRLEMYADLAKENRKRKLVSLESLGEIIE
ncbi:MAG: TIGR03936 family radical SAM-associated protein [Lachnospiraceae bacterium]|nr:TIGR03936 family radical SAM-associated protein [Lachnospiraceae bacterium]